MLAENHVDDLIPGYALDSLNQEEMLQVSEHLSQCQACQDELAVYQKVVNAFSLAVPPASPAPELKQKILDNLPGRPAPRVAPRKGAVRTWFWNRLQIVTPTLAAFSFLLVLFLAVGTVWQAQRIQRLEAATPANFGVITLAGTTHAPGATGMLVISRDGNLGTLIVDNLTTLDQTHQYQLWLIHNNQRSSGGVFSVSQDGYGALMIHSPLPLITYSSFGITVEPTGGSPGPTGEKVMGGGS